MDMNQIGIAQLSDRGKKIEKGKIDNSWEIVVRNKKRG